IPGVVRSFLHPVRIQHRRVNVGGGSSSSASSSKSKKKHAKKHKHETPSALAPGLIEAKAEMENAAAPIIAPGKVTFPFYLPSELLGGTALASYNSPHIDNPYPYKIYDRNVDKNPPHGRPHQAYRFSFLVNRLQGGFYGVEGTSWKNPPIIANPS